MEERGDCLREGESLVSRLHRFRALQTEYWREKDGCRRRLQALSKHVDALLGEGRDEGLGRLRAELSLFTGLFPRPAAPLLVLALGSSANWDLGPHRLAYKSQYEHFKVRLTMLHLGLCALLLVVRRERLRWWLDVAGNLLLVYGYATTVLREHILQVNGSKIRRWWIVHHYLSMAVAITMLFWQQQADTGYYLVRGRLLVFGMYVSAVQILQYRYQMRRLYLLRTLARVDAMATTTESADVHVSSRKTLDAGLVFLLPFLLAGHGWQLALGWILAGTRTGTGTGEWQSRLLALLFVLLAVGNVGTTAWTILAKKFRPSRE